MRIKVNMKMKNPVMKVIGRKVIIEL